MSGEQSWRKRKLLKSDTAQLNNPIFMHPKMPEFFEKSPLSGSEKHPDFTLTL